MRFLFTIILLVGLSFFDKSVQGEEVTTETNNLKSNESEALYAAIKAGDTDVVTSLIESGININVVDESRHSYLHSAVIHGKSEIVKIFLEHGVNLSTETYDSCNNSALHWAAVNGNVETAKLLLEHGAKLNKRNYGKITPLGLASFFGNTQIIEFLIKNGAELNYSRYVDDTPFESAAALGHLETCKFLIANIANVSERELTGALFMANLNGTKELIEYLIDLGADVNAEIDGRTVLHDAFEFGNEEMKEVLIKHGADLSAKDKYNKTPSEMNSEKGIKERDRVLANLKEYRKGFGCTKPKV